MNRQQRKEAFLLVSNGGFLDSLEKGWDKVKSEFSDLSVKKTVDEIFGDSKTEEAVEKKLDEKPGLKKELQKTVSPPSDPNQPKEQAPKKEKSLKEVLTNLVQEMRDVMTIKEKEQAIAAPKQDLPVKQMIEGYKRPSGNLPSDAHQEAEKLLDLPLGSAKSIKLNDGKWYTAVVEEHFDNHPRGYGDPYTHKGVSLFEPIAGNGEDRGKHIA